MASASGSGTTTSTTTTTTIGPELDSLVFWWDAGNPVSYQSYYGQQSYSSPTLNDCSPPHQYRFGGILAGDSYKYTGKFGGSITFKNANVQMTQGLSASYLNNSLSYSMTVVVFPTVTGVSYVSELGQLGPGGWTSQNLAQNATSKAIIAAEYSSNDGNYNVCESEPATASTPYVITYTYDTPTNYNGSNGNLKIYVNGVLQGTQTGVNRTPPYLNGQGYAFSFGNYTTYWDLGQSCSFSGEFIAMMMHSITLSDQQVKEIYEYYLPRFSIPEPTPTVVAGKGFLAYGATNSVLLNSCSRLTYGTNIISAESAAIAPVRASAASVVKTGGNGYVVGGQTGACINNISVFSPSTVTWTANASTSTAARCNNSGIQSSTVGYIGGGRTSVGATAGVNNIDKLVFSTNVCSANTGTLVNAPIAPAGLTNIGLICGYWSGGYTASNTTTTQRQRFNFALEQSTSMTTGLLYSLANMCSFYSNLNGYMMGGFSPSLTTEAWGIVSIASKINYSTETLSYINNIPYVINYASGLQSSVSGYILGGAHTSDITTRTLQMSFSTEITFCNDPYLLDRNYLGNGLATTV